VTTYELVHRWRARADELEPYAAPAAVAYRTAAAELDAALRTAEDELLAPADASRESGLSERRLRELRSEGRLADHGTPGRPKYRRGELPRRARGGAGGWDAEAHVRRIVGGVA